MSDKSLTYHLENKNAYVAMKCMPRTLGVFRSLAWGLCGLAVRRLPRVQGVVGSNPTEGKIFGFYYILLYLEWNVKNCFVKLM